MKAVGAEVLAALRDGVNGAGAQLVIARGGTTICDLAVGDALPDRALTRDTVQALLCLTKPVVAAGVCGLAEARGIGVDDDVAEASPRLARMVDGRRVCLRDVLTHTAGLHAVVSPQVLLAGRPRRVAFSEQLTWVPEWRIGEDRAYSDFQGWNVLRIWLEDVSGADFGAAMRELVLGPLGIRDMYFGFSDAEWSDVVERLGVHYEIDGGSARPMLHELSRRFINDPPQISLGAYGTAIDLARFYRATLDALTGKATAGLPSPALLREMIRPTGPAAEDPLLQSALSFGMGFMTDLALGLGGPIGPRAYGHMGAFGSSFAFADPDADLVVAYVSNAFPYLVGNRPQVLAARRAIVEAIYNDYAVAA
jgi:CubicO group peptidase (beta-lactamase class C family)